MSDGVTLFHASHDNVISSSSTLGVPSLGEARRVLRSQKLMDGVTPLNAKMRYLVVPAALESDALSTINSELLASNVANPVQNVAEIVVEARLDALSTVGWYAFGDPALYPVLELAYLDGSRRGSSSNGAPLLRTFKDQNCVTAIAVAPRVRGRDPRGGREEGRAQVRGEAREETKRRLRRP
jgi:hypothetical protein